MLLIPGTRAGGWRLHWWVFVSPLRARYFLLRCQEKVPKEKAARSITLNGACHSGFPVLLGKTGARPTRRSRYARFGLEQGAHSIRFFLRCSAAPTGLKTSYPAHVGKPSGSPFFWVLFFGEAKKSTSPKGRKNLNEQSQLQAAPQTNLYVCSGLLTAMLSPGKCARRRRSSSGMLPVRNGSLAAITGMLSTHG